MRKLLLAAVAAAALAALPAAGSAASSVPRVTVIGDSVASALAGSPRALTILGQGVNLDLELAPCRRVGEASCPYDGVRPPNVIDLVQSKGTALGPNVVVAVGYNDFEDQYAKNIEDALAALHDAGVKHVLWLTLRAVHHPYLNMNDDIVAAAAHHPEMTVVDWNLYARSHPDWFNDDGLHLNDAGAQAMATLLHAALDELGIPLAPPPPLAVATTSLPGARVGRDYAVRLAARGGTTPYRWSSAARLPRGLHLTATGRLWGDPRRAGASVLQLRVVDAGGHAAAVRLALRVSA